MNMLIAMVLLLSRNGFARRIDLMNNEDLLSLAMSGNPHTHYDVEADSLEEREIRRLEDEDQRKFVSQAGVRDPSPPQHVRFQASDVSVQWGSRSSEVDYYLVQLSECEGMVGKLGWCGEYYTVGKSSTFGCSLGFLLSGGYINPESEYKIRVCGCLNSESLDDCARNRRKWVKVDMGKFPQVPSVPPPAPDLVPKEPAVQVAIQDNARAMKKDFVAFTKLTDGQKQERRAEYAEKRKKRKAYEKEAGGKRAAEATRLLGAEADEPYNNVYKMMLGLMHASYPSQNEKAYALEQGIGMILKSTDAALQQEDWLQVFRRAAKGIGELDAARKIRILTQSYDAAMKIALEKANVESQVKRSGVRVPQQKPQQQPPDVARKAQPRGPQMSAEGAEISARLQRERGSTLLDSLPRAGQKFAKDVVVKLARGGQFPGSKSTVAIVTDRVGDYILVKPCVQDSSPCEPMDVEKQTYTSSILEPVERAPTHADFVR